MLLVQNQIIALPKLQTPSRLSDMRMMLKEEKSAKALYSVPVDLDPKLSPLYESITMYCWNKVQVNWERRLHFAAFRASPHLFYIKLESYAMYKLDPLDEKEFFGGWFQSLKGLVLLKCLNMAINCTWNAHASVGGGMAMTVLLFLRFPMSCQIQMTLQFARTKYTMQHTWVEILKLTECLMI